MKWELRTAAEYDISEWSGGTTTQMAIFPECAVYAQRDFLWRLSSARVEQEHSVFTSLPDYDRLIATLQGTMELKIGEKPWKKLEPLETCSFDGGARVESRGKCRDFNLMLRKGACQGKIHAMRFSPGDTADIKTELPATEKYPETVLALYCLGGGTYLEGPDIRIQPEQLLVCRNPASLRFRSDGISLLAVSVREKERTEK